MRPAGGSVYKTGLKTNEVHFLDLDRLQLELLNCSGEKPVPRREHPALRGGLGGQPLATRLMRPSFLPLLLPCLPASPPPPPAPASPSPSCCFTSC